MCIPISVDASCNTNFLGVSLLNHSLPTYALTLCRRLKFPSLPPLARYGIVNSNAHLWTVPSALAQTIGLVRSSLPFFNFIYIFLYIFLVPDALPGSSEFKLKLNLCTYAWSTTAFTVHTSIIVLVHPTIPTYLHIQLCVCVYRASLVLQAACCTSQS